MKIVILAGSTRMGATSTRAASYAARLIEEQGHEVTMVDLHTHRLPLYCSDDEIQPDEVLSLRQAVLEANAVVLSTPEYHGSISGALKNALDFLSSEQFDSKPVLSISSAGGAVGVNSLQHLQTIVRNVHGINCPEWISLGGVQREFDADGVPVTQGVQLRIHHAVHYFLELAAKLLKE
ncbi:NADPH-dependent FMN reductase [Paenibacillus nasutitermitis]|uniref:FMN reductase n=1 Tax=Paenibacillus nasutitermitis TaxID=1652958 RepID=A0A916Z364_9BACL|nr:NADPH-dependent FMN reductase [Paenibacillus nasutitermitis]GGD73816.1 FMN reductase [Paenibacillus nasutitermitis]